MKAGRIKSNFVSESLRLNSDFHLSEGVVYHRIISNKKHELLGQLSSEIFCAGRSKRTYVDRTCGIPYFGNTDIMSSDPSLACNYISKKFWNEKKGIIREGMILTGRVGQNTVGSFTYANKEIEGKIGSDNIIRIINNNIVPNGYLFSFLASKYGYHLSRRHISGNAQPFITEDMLATIPVPILSESIQKKVHELILDAACMRHESYKNLYNARELLLRKANLSKLNKDEYDYFGVSSSKRNTPVYTTSKPLASSFNAFHHSPKRFAIIKKIIESNNVIALSETLNARGIHSPNAIKVIPVEKGVKFINQRDIFNYRFPHQLLSRRDVVESNLLEIDDILIAGIGTLGENEVFCRVIFVGESLKEFLPAGNFLKLQVDKRKILPGYLFAWLSTEYGFRLLRYTHTGTKQCILKHDFMKDIPIPLLDESYMKEINDMVIKSHNESHQALNLENQAVRLIEKEIESWQVA